MKILRHIFLTLVIGFSVTGLTGCGAQESVAEPVPRKVDSEFKTVDLDDFIDQEKKAAAKLEGRKSIKMAAPVRFSAKVKRYPEAKRNTYIYTALEMARVNPLPNVSHQMFVESEQGVIISVYVENRVAARLSDALKEDERAAFLAYHVYTYAKGPALLIVDFEMEPKKGHQ